MAMSFESVSLLTLHPIIVGILTIGILGPNELSIRDVNAVSSLHALPKGSCALPSINFIVISKI
jgi:hypothetical protein